MLKVNYQDVATRVEDVLAVNGDELQSIEFIVGISRGGLFPAMVVSTTMVKPLVAAYINKQDEVFFDRDKWIKDKNVLLVDDIVRTGKTIGLIKHLLLNKGAASVKTLTPYYLEVPGIEVADPDFGVATPEDIEFPWDE